ncbi:Uncharacterised protein [Candidatus Gugararchaeum adminiculabundum]|nr:Uncharacterised protein [Candidatus Gugararchaeum adminiculabundum]
MHHTLKRGQFFSFDVIMGAVVFLIALFLLTTYWWGIRNSFDDTRENMYLATLRVSDLLMTPGAPTNWADPGAVAGQYGLMKNWTYQKLDIYKAKRFLSLTRPITGNYNDIKKSLGAQNYEFYITIENVSYPAGSASNPNSLICCDNNDPCINPCIFGARPTNAIESVSVDRTATLPSGEAVKIHTILWRNASTFTR